MTHDLFRRRGARRRALPSVHLTAFAVLFVAAGATFLGHHYEGKRPALLDNIFQGFIGPMFLVAETLVASGYRPRSSRHMGEGDVTAR